MARCGHRDPSPKNLRCATIFRPPLKGRVKTMFGFHTKTT